MKIPKITFGMIVLNGEPFTRYNLHSLYSHAHQIIVVEGACPGACNIASEAGHSIDGTLETLTQFKAEEDPDNKLLIVTAEAEGHADGFWPGEKDEMSQAYAKRATGNYLWQVDSDEFYHADDMAKIMKILADGCVDAITFPMITFWGGIDYIVDGFYLRRDKAREYHRLFAWGPGYCYKTHRPPTVLDERGTDTRSKRWLQANEIERMGIYLYHYSLLFPHQVVGKSSYYAQITERCNRADQWAINNYLTLSHRFRYHNVYDQLSWLERYVGNHPLEVLKMMTEIKDGHIDCKLRRTDDIEAMLIHPVYRLARLLLLIYEVIWLAPWNRFRVTPVGRQMYRIIYGISHPFVLLGYLRRQLVNIFPKDKTS